jgi:hypothetical protein
MAMITYAKKALSVDLAEREVARATLLSKPYTRVELATKVRYVLDNVDAG